MNEKDEITRVCWNGCSFTVGDGFPIHQRDQYIYDRLVSKQFGFESTNISVSGSSNLEIFKRSAQAILNKEHDIVITQWSALNRLRLHPGPDCSFVLNDTKYSEFKYRDIYIDSNTKTLLRKMLLLLNHDYHNLLDLIEYCCILDYMAVASNVKVIFVNGLVPWTDDLNCTLPSSDIGSSLSDYTKSMLDFDHRDDLEVITFFQELQRKFLSIDQRLWVNLFDSMMRNSPDIGPEGHHPGPLSHQIMATKISDYITRNNLQ